MHHVCNLWNKNVTVNHSFTFWRSWNHFSHMQNGTSVIWGWNGMLLGFFFLFPLSDFSASMWNYGGCGGYHKLFWQFWPSKCDASHHVAAKHAGDPLAERRSKSSGERSLARRWDWWPCIAACGEHFSVFHLTARKLHPMTNLRESAQNLDVVSGDNICK